MATKKKGATAEQFHLLGVGFSGRGVRLRRLEPGEKDEAFLHAAVMAQGNDKAFHLGRYREAVTRMIVAVTAETVPRREGKGESGKVVDMTHADLMAAKWTKVTPADLQREGTPLSYDALFTS